MLVHHLTSKQPQSGGWQARDAAVRRQAVTEAPRVNWQFVGGRKQEASPSGTWGIAALFVLFGAGMGSLAARCGVPAQLFFGDLLYVLSADPALLAPYAQALAGAVLGYVAAAGYLVASSTTGLPERTRRLAWTFWSMALVMLLARAVGDWVAQSVAVIPWGERSLILNGVLFNLIACAVVYLLGVGIDGQMNMNRYDHDDNVGPIGLAADRQRDAQVVITVMLLSMVLVSFVGLVLLF